MSTVTISGYSDDIVEIRAPGVDDEIDSYEDPVHLAFSDGTHLSMEWCPEGHEGYGWKATIIERGTATITLAPATDPEGAWPAYTDQVAIGPVTWVERIDEPDTDGDDEPVTRWDLTPEDAQ